MIQPSNTKILNNQFVLTPEQKVALLEGKIARAEQHIKALAELAKKITVK
jgi:hypothetical protein